MNKAKGLLCIMLTLLMLLTGCSSVSTKSYDTTILDTANEIATELEFSDKTYNPFVDGSRYFDVIEKSESEFVVDVNGADMTIQLSSDKNSSEYKPTSITDVPSKYNKVFSESKALVCKYIDSSEILQDKEDIKEYIQTLSIKKASFTDDYNVGAYFSDSDECVYINGDNLDNICEWMLVHELVHAVSYYTHNCNLNNEAYCYDIFNEVMTDIITASLNPDINKSIQSGYAIYYSLVYPYIDIVGQDAIEAYFYGYDQMFNMISKDEFDFFVIVINNYGEENSDVYYNNLILKWYATY